MSTRVFAFAILLMLFGIQTVYFVAQRELSGVHEYAFELELLKKEIQKEKLKTEIAYHELESFKQQVATALPKDINKEKYSVRNIASLVRGSDASLSDLKLDLEFKEIKKTYLRKEYEKSAVQFSQFLEMYPESPHVLEAYYLLVNSLNNSSQYEKCIKIVNILVDQFPESEMTGLSLLIMANIFKTQERYDEARGIYQTVIQNFEFPELKRQARQKIEEINL